MPFSNQKLTFRSPKGESIQLEGEKATLKSYGLANGDMLYMDSPETAMSEEELSEVKAKAQESGAAHNITNNRLGVVKAVSALSGKEVKEDEIDRIIAADDGWIKRERSSLCNHPIKGQCARCMPIAPWSIQTHPDFESLNLKHIPFHSWLREKEYRSPNNPVYLDDPTWKVEGANAISAKSATFSVVLERQPYRHVDHLEFEDSKILDNFIGAWRASGKQRCGFLLGKYVRENSGIPLGIGAQVCAIYEPPQRGSIEEVTLLKDANEAKVDEICEKFGLVRVGFVWTALRVDAQRKIIPDRDPSQYVLTSQECVRMAAFQNKYASPCARSNSGTFGSKFVSVLVYGNEEGNIEIAAYQMSNQVSRLVRDGVARSSKNDPGFLRAKASTPDLLLPDVYFSHKNEYGLLVQSKADPTFPIDFGIVSVRHSFPRDPQPLFTSVQFPVENRTAGVPSATNAQAALAGKRGPAFLAALSDFHLILFLCSQNLDLAPLLARACTTPPTISEQEIRPLIETLLPKASSSAPSSSSSSFTAAPLQTPGASSSPKPNTAQLSAKGLEIVEQLVAMGFDKPRATEAVWATGTSSVDQALSFLMD